MQRRSKFQSNLGCVKLGGEGGEDLGSYDGILNYIRFEKQCGHNNNLALYTSYIRSQYHLESPCCFLSKMKSNNESPQYQHILVSFNGPYLWETWLASGNMIL